MDLFVIFVFGLSVGSFLNVLIDRIPHTESIWKKRSHCDHCKKTLRWYDLIPVVSWISLGGKCRYCQSPISIQYPLVELVTGLSFVITSLYLPALQGQAILSAQFSGLALFRVLAHFYWLWIISALIVVLVTDLKYGIIPDLIVFPTMILAFIKIIMEALSSGVWDFNNIITAFIGGFLFLLLHELTKGRGMGFGDVKFVFLMGIILGHPGLWVALYVAFLTGAAAGVILILTGQRKLKQTIPFGPFLVAGSFVALFGGKLILAWWMKFII